MCRKAGNGYRVGPWVCDFKNPRVARELLIKCMEKTGQDVKLYVGIPSVNKIGLEILQEFGFEQYSKGVRMHFGKKLENEHADGIFAIGGPEKG
jgi:hypothetical protein